MAARLLNTGPMRPPYVSDCVQRRSGHPTGPGFRVFDRLCQTTTSAPETIMMSHSENFVQPLDNQSFTAVEVFGVYRSVALWRIESYVTNARSRDSRSCMYPYLNDLAVKSDITGLCGKAFA